MTNCTVDLNNLSKTLCEANYGQIKQLWLDQSQTGLTFANAMLEAQWTAKIYATAASRMFVLNPTEAIQIDATTAEATFKEGNTGKRKKIRNGYLDIMFRYDGLTVCQMNKLQELDGLNLYAYVITEKNVIIGGTTSTNIIPVPVEIFVSDAIPPVDNNDDWGINVYVRFTNTSGNFGKAIEPTAFNPKDLDGIINVEITFVSSDVSDKKVIFTVVRECDGTEVSDLTTATDVVVTLVSTGAALTSATMTNVGNTYTLLVDAGTPLTEFPYYLSLKPAATATQKKYETTGYSNEITPAA